MQEDRMEAVFQTLQKNVPRAPEPLVERMVKTVNLMDRERARRAGVNAEERQMQQQAVRQRQRGAAQNTPDVRAAKKPAAPELKPQKPLGM